MKGWTYVRTYSVRTLFSEPKFPGCIGYPFSYPWCFAAHALRARAPLKTFILSLGCLWSYFVISFTLIFKEISYFTLFQKKTNFAFFYVWFSLFVLTRVIGRGSNIVIFFNGRQNKTFKPSSKFFHNGRLINLSVDFFGKTSRFPVIF